MHPTSLRKVVKLHQSSPQVMPRASVISLKTRIWVAPPMKWSKYLLNLPSFLNKESPLKTISRIMMEVTLQKKMQELMVQCLMLGLLVYTLLLTELARLWITTRMGWAQCICLLSPILAWQVVSQKILTSTCSSSTMVPQTPVDIPWVIPRPTLFFPITSFSRTLQTHKT